jgi:hypothetical protein
MPAQDFTEQILKLDGGYIAFLDDGSTFVSFVLPPAENDQERYRALADRLRELADEWD